jgi:hypothetical protein
LEAQKPAGSISPNEAVFQRDNSVRCLTTDPIWGGRFMVGAFIRVARSAWIGLAASRMKIAATAVGTRVVRPDATVFFVIRGAPARLVGVATIIGGRTDSTE